MSATQQREGKNELTRKRKSAVIEVMQRKKKLDPNLIGTSLSRCVHLSFALSKKFSSLKNFVISKGNATPA